MIRVLFLSDVPHEAGGGERRLLSLVPALRTRGIEPLLAAVPGSELSEKLAAQGIEVLPLPELRGNPLAAARRLARVCRERGIDIINTGSFLTDLCGRLAGARAGVKVISTVNCEPDSYKLAGRGLKRRLFYPVRNIVDRALARRTSAFIAVSRAVAEKLIARGIPRERVAVVPNGIDVATVQAAAGGTAQVSGGGRDVHIGTIARLDPAKGLDVLIRAVKMLVDRGLPVKATIVGEGGERTSLERLIEGLGLIGVVELSGYVANPYPWLATCDIYTVSSRSEGQNITVLEAMALGRPVVSTAAGGISDMVVDGVSGLLVPTEDPAALAEGIERLAGDEAERRRLAADGTAVVARFSIESMVDGVMTAYESTLAGRPVDVS